jgi:hypothetical protein
VDENNQTYVGTGNKKKSHESSRELSLVIHNGHGMLGFIVVQRGQK